MSYSHLTDDQSNDIYLARKAGHSLTFIANLVRCHKSTVSREIWGNSGARGYQPKQAHQLASERLQMRRGGIPVSAAAWARSQELLRSVHSPEQSAGRAQAEEYGRISHETIYQRVYRDKPQGRSLYKRLRCRKLRRRRHGSGRSRRGRISNRTGIEKRCPRVDARAIVGHWEADTVIGRNRKSVL